jgi:hypothetical protein
MQWGFHFPIIPPQRTSRPLPHLPLVLVVVLLPLLPPPSPLVLVVVLLPLPPPPSPPPSTPPRCLPLPAPQRRRSWTRCSTGM